MRGWSVLLWVGLGVGVGQGANLQKTCSLNPTMDDDNAVQDGGSFTLQESVPKKFLFQFIFGNNIVTCIVVTYLTLVILSSLKLF